MNNLELQRKALKEANHLTAVMAQDARHCCTEPKGRPRGFLRLRLNPKEFDLLLSSQNGSTRDAVGNGSILSHTLPAKHSLQGGEEKPEP